MSKLFMFEKPLGMRDTLPSLYHIKKKVNEQITDEIEKWGYEFMETPTLEYYETVGEVSAILDAQLFKLMDQQGHTLVLRPDMTTPIARVAASKLYHGNHPLRLAYTANVFRTQEREGGRPSEFEQIGIECIGDGTIDADGETIALLISALKRAGLKNFAITIGHIGFVQGLFSEVVGDDDIEHNLKTFLYEKNYVGFKNYVKQLSLSIENKERLLSLLKLRGDHQTIIEAAEYVESDEGIQAVEELKRLMSSLDAHGVMDYVKFDLNLLSHLSYYTGILFEVHAENVGFLLGNGGRYNHLFEKFDCPTPATGFGIRTDCLLEALDVCEEVVEKECILYEQQVYQQAIQLAQEKRANGIRIVLQNLDAVKDLEQCKQQYRKVTILQS